MVHPCEVIRLIIRMLLREQSERPFERQGIFQPEGARFCADEGRKVRAGAEGLAEVAREGADVRALRARDADMRLRQP